MIEKGISLEAALNSVGPGWANLIKLAYSTFNILPFYVVVTCVKEKYGTLRLYVDIADYSFLRSHSDAVADSLYDFIQALEDYSGTVCEQCSAPATRNIRTFVYETLCSDCLKRKN